MTSEKETCINCGDVIPGGDDWKDMLCLKCLRDMELEIEDSDDDECVF